MVKNCVLHDYETVKYQNFNNLSQISTSEFKKNQIEFEFEKISHFIILSKIKKVSKSV